MTQQNGDDKMGKCACIICQYHKRDMPTPPAKIWMDGEVIDELCQEHGESAKQFLESIELLENHVSISRKRSDVSDQPGE